MFRRLMLFCLVLTGVFATTSMRAQQAPASPAAATPTAPPQAGPRGGGRGAPPVKSPEVSDGRVTFRLRAPNAKEVAVALAGNRLTMQKDEQGVWSATTRRPRARLLHLLDCGRWHDHQRPGESPGSDVVQQFPVDVRGAGLAAVAASCRRGSRCHRPPRVPFDDRERRPRLLRLPARRATTHGARGRTRCSICCTASVTMPSDG